MLGIFGLSEFGRNENKKNFLMRSLLPVESVD